MFGALTAGGHDTFALKLTSFNPHFKYVSQLLNICIYLDGGLREGFLAAVASVYPSFLIWSARRTERGTAICHLQLDVHSGISEEAQSGGRFPVFLQKQRRLSSLQWSVLMQRRSCSAGRRRWIIQLSACCF